MTSDTCAICLTNFTNEEVAIPQTCNHAFCKDCLESWTKKNKSCPIDRKYFYSKSIVPNYKIYKSYMRRLHPSEYIWDIICQKCRIGDNASMRSCLSCKFTFHEKCLDSLNCPPEWKDNDSDGLHVKHEFCKNFNHNWKPTSDDNADMELDSDMGSGTESDGLLSSLDEDEMYSDDQSDEEMSVDELDSHDDSSDGLGISDDDDDDDADDVTAITAARLLFLI